MFEVQDVLSGGGGGGELDLRSGFFYECGSKEKEQESGTWHESA
jgi:hypothetical protein